MRRRRLAQLILLASTLMVAMMLVAGPALATEGEDAEDTTQEGEREGDEAGGFGTNKADPVIVAAIAGVLMGAFAFSQSDPGGIERVTDDH